MEQKNITNEVREMSTPCALMLPTTAIGLKRKGVKHMFPLTYAIKDGQL